MPPLLVAVTSYRTVDEFEEVLKLLLHGKCRLEGSYPQSLYTPLYLSVCLDKRDVAISLLQHGANPNVDCPQDLTILQKVCYKGQRDLALFLLKCDIDWSREHWLDVDIYHSGIDIRLLTMYHEQVPIALIKDTNLYETIQNVRYNPFVLKHICRSVLRKYLKHPFYENLPLLCLPPSVENYLMLK